MNTNVARLPKGGSYLMRGGNLLRAKGSQEIGFVTQEIAFVYFVKGAGVYQLGEREHMFSAGDCLIRFPGEKHSVFHKEEGDSYYFALPEEVYRLWCTLGYTFSSPIVHLGLDREVREFFNWVIKELGRLPEDKLILVANKIQMWLWERVVALNDQESTHPVEPWLEEAKSILSNNLDQKLELREVSDSLGVSYNTFRKGFKESVGMSPGEYRISYKMEMAKRWVMNQEIRFQEIPDQLGFYDYYAFSAQFKKYTGVSPKAFKLQNSYV